MNEQTPPPGQFPNGQMPPGQVPPGGPPPEQDPGRTYWEGVPGQAAEPPPGEQGGNSRRKWIIGGTAAVAVPVVVLGGFFGASLLRGGESGAGSAQEAASTFVDSLEKNDATRATQFIVPAESTGLPALMNEGAKKAQEGEGREKEASPNDLLAGVTIKTTGAKTTVSDLPVPADGVKKVEFTGGSVKASYDPAKADPLMKDFIKSMGGENKKSSESGSIADARKETGHNPYVVVVKDGDSWYVSPTYTVLEQMAQEEGVKPAAGTVKTESFSSPKAAAQAYMKATVDGANAGDPDAVLKTLSPYEAQLMKRYRPLLDKETGGEAPQEKVKLTSNEFEEPTNEGDRMRIRPKNVTLAAESGDSGESLTIKGGCLVIEGESSCTESKFGRLLDKHAKGFVVKEGSDGWNVLQGASSIAIVTDFIKGASRADLEDVSKEV
ncbi:hypothetical protein [Demetria terragena]|uniref:hypothetical protein n=1 Tax=Demetria terragena TaxID=63959 RepID=UPI0003A66866|nr:hypothetical protein [Demetria terragena]